MVTPSRRLPLNIEVRLPNLRWPDNYTQESSKDRRYNCIAWASDINTLRFWPNVRGYRWPDGIPKDETPEAFIQFFARQGYEVCLTPDTEDRFDKIAIYTDSSGVIHAAKQRPSGHWASKLGENEDIEHHSLQSIEGGTGQWNYGRASIFMRRRRAP